MAEQAVAMGCGHLLCFRCFGHNNVESTRVCPIEGCGHDLTKPGELREVTVESEIGHDRLVLAGYRPDQAVEALLRSFQVSQQQQRDFLEKMITNERQRNKRLRAQCEKKLTDVHTGYKNAKKKYEQERTSRQALEGALKELRDKYNEKAQYVVIAFWPCISVSKTGIVKLREVIAKQQVRWTSYSSLSLCIDY